MLRETCEHNLRPAEQTGRVLPAAVLTGRSLASSEEDETLFEDGSDQRLESAEAMARAEKRPEAEDGLRLHGPDQVGPAHGGPQPGQSGPLLDLSGAVAANILQEAAVLVELKALVRSKALSSEHRGSGMKKESDTCK